ncbi:hypothetical protein V1387_10385 [Allomuricauda taeanensis]|uniref:hypothetical protein n=1 Tax=Flagellimonas taeanensis TaxID=1005926 RepID=UPI002E7B9B95|nr:hypothetical protein [Allomuricauda taeanensis]MEE1963091.1 hypothetical protein [Allomuricauda taeanensis]
MAKKKIIITIILFSLAIAAVFIIPLFFKKDLKEALADIFNTDKDNLILNLPPSPSRFPGTILLPHGDSYLVHSLNTGNDENLVMGEKFSVSAVVDDFKSIKSTVSSGFLDGVFSNRQHFEMSVEIKDGQILELPIPLLKEYVQNTTSVKKTLDKRQIPVILNRAYKGVVTYFVSAIDKKGAEILAEIENEAGEITKSVPSLSIEGFSKTDKKISFQINEPIIIAFEALSIDFVMNNLATDPGEIKFNQIHSEELYTLAEENGKSINHLQNKTSWGLVTIGSGHYKYLATYDIPEAVYSAEKVSEVMGKYNPKFSKQLLSNENDVLTDDKILDWTIQLHMELLENPVDYLIVYYSGHGLSLPNGEMTLPQGNLQKDFAETALKNMTPTAASPSDGYILAETLYDSFDVMGIPFTLLLDACYENEEMQDALLKVSMTLGDKDGSNLLYHGDEALITNEMGKLGNALYDIGQRFDYRKRSNPVIFSSKPGTVSNLENNPESYFEYRLAPIAARLARYHQFNTPSDPIPLNKLISNITDLKSGIGEISLEGTTTWSDLDVLNNALDSNYSKFQ